VYLDDAPVRPKDDSVNYHGNSFITKNIALIVALFWHPR